MGISNTERPLLEYVRSVVGTGRITNKVRTLDHHSFSFAYVIANRQALALLARVTPYLRTYKSERARLLLAEYLQVTPRNGRYSPQQQKAKAEFEARFLAIRVRTLPVAMEPESPMLVNAVAYEDGSYINSPASFEETNHSR